MTTATAPTVTSQTTTTTLETARFLSLTTFRRSGVPVATPVLFVADGERLLVRTARDAGKLKRLAHTSRVLVAPADQRGREVGAVLPGEARVLGADAVGPMLALLHRRYRVAGPLFTLVRCLRRQPDVIVEITLDRSTR